MNIQKIIFLVVATLILGLYLWWRKRMHTIIEFRKKYEKKYTPKYEHTVMKFMPNEVLVRIGRSYRIFWVSERGKWHSRPIEYHHALVY